jgi:hypothetical protein
MLVVFLFGIGRLECLHKINICTLPVRAGQPRRPHGGSGHGADRGQICEWRRREAAASYRRHGGRRQTKHQVAGELRGRSRRSACPVTDSASCRAEPGSPARRKRWQHCQSVHSCRSCANLILSRASNDFRLDSGCTLGQEALTKPWGPINAFLRARSPSRAVGVKFRPKRHCRVRLTTPARQS